MEKELKEKYDDLFRSEGIEVVHHPKEKELNEILKKISDAMTPEQKGDPEMLWATICGLFHALGYVTGDSAKEIASRMIPILELQEKMRMMDN